MEQRLHCCHGTMIKSCTENLIFFRNVSGISKLLPSVAISAKKNWSFSWTTGFLKLLSGVSQGVWNCVFVLYTFLTLLERKQKEKKSSVIDNISTSAQRKEKLWNLVLKKHLMTYHRKRLATQSLKYCKCALNNATRGSPKKYRRFYESKQLNARATDSFIYEFEEIYPQILSKNREESLKIAVRDITKRWLGLGRDCDQRRREWDRKLISHNITLQMASSPQ